MKPLISLLSFLFAIQVGFAQSKPNIIVILSDDAGYADFGFQTKRLIPTPNIDRIANEGVKFTNAYVTGAVCCPSRAGLLTGINQAEFGHVYNYIQGVKYNIPKDSFGIRTDQKLVGDYLKPLGYKTGIIGKWHEGFSKAYHPNQRGFDHFWGFLWGSSSYLAGTANLVEENGKPVPAETIPYMTDAIGDESVKFIEANSKQPFFLYVAFNAPHTPMQAKPGMVEKFKSQFPTEGRALNAAMTYTMDENVGKILAKLEQLKILDNTLIVFTNDNGGQVTNSFADNYPLRGMKSDVYEGGIRVPMAIRWKGKIKPGGIFDEPVTTLDFIPTFIDAAGGKAGNFKQLEGSDLVQMINGSQKGKSAERPLYWCVAQKKGAIRLGDYKMDFLPGKQPELYNLKTDINESDNLYQRQPEIAQKMESLFEQWKKSLPKPNWVAMGKDPNGKED